MNMRSAISKAILAVGLGLLAQAPVGAQSPPTPNWPSVSEHHQRQIEMMRDMSRGMSEMTEQMAHGDLAADQNKLMSGRMKRMSVLMDRMSFLQSRPTMREPEFEKQMGSMRKQMDEMMRDPSANSKTK
mgnify:CR=1 FL=1